MTTILYVEDHPPARLLMTAIIAELTDYTLITASDGAEAQMKAETAHPDLYILDLDLPDTDGVTLATALRRIHAAPILFVSAYAESVRADQIAGDGIAGYLAKPLDPDHVAAVIQHALS